MKIDREHFTTENGYKFLTATKEVGVIADKYGTYYRLYEIETDETIGIICEADVRSSWTKYYYARFYFNESNKKLCTKANYQTALGLLLEEYRRAKA